MRGKGLVVAGALALALAACGGGGSTSYANAADLAKATGCTGFSEQDGQLFTRSGGTCTLDGKDIFVYTFPDNSTRDQWLSAAKAAGGVFAAGEKWALQSDDAGAATKAAKAAGGSVK